MQIAKMLLDKDEIELIMGLSSKILYVRRQLF